MFEYAECGRLRTLSSFGYRQAVQGALGKARTVYLWQHDYIAALAETDPAKQRQRVYEAIVAIEQRLLSPLELGSEEHQALESAARALKRLKKSMSEG